MSCPPSPPALHVAIVGGGITGLCLGIGLHARGVPFTIYERASGVQEVGAGIGLSPNAEWAMKVLSPAVHAAYEKVANPNGEDYFQWVNGQTKELIFRLFVGEGCFRGCRRSDFLEELVKCVPGANIKFGMMVEEVREREDGGMIIKFANGEEEVADTVIGSDGIRSRLRAQLFPSSAATYTHKYSFRALIPMAQAQARLGQEMVSTRFMYNGPNAHIITYPVAGNTFLNTLAVVSDAESWSAAPGGGHTGRATKEEATRAFAGWHQDVKAIVELLPEEMDKWAIFDMLENPIQQYHSAGNVCLAGDAAHAVGPHLGAGAGFGIEDACLLAELLKQVQDRLSLSQDGGARSKMKVLESAFGVFTEVRHERTQWLVKHTRETVDLFEWKEPEMAKDRETYGREITWRFHKIWHYDIQKMVEQGKRALVTLV